MFRRWRSAFVLTFLTGALFLFPQDAHAQFFFGGGNLFGRPTWISPYRGPANLNLYNPYGSGPFGGMGYGGFGGMYGPFGGYGGYGGFGRMGYGGMGYLPGGFINAPSAAGVASFSTAPVNLAYTPGLYPLMPNASGTGPGGVDNNALPGARNRTRNALYDPPPTSARMRPTLSPAVGISPAALIASQRGQNTVQRAQNTAMLQVTVPSADAQVWVQGAKTTQTGTVREFESPPLTPGSNYTYTVRARWTPPGGQPVTQTRKVQIQAGGRASVEFSAQP